MIAAMIVVVIVPVSIGMPPMAIFIPPLVRMRPAVLPRFMQLLPRVYRLPAFPSMVFNRFVQTMIRFRDPTLARSFIGAYPRYSDE